MTGARILAALAFVVFTPAAFADETRSVYAGVGKIRENLSGENKKMVALDDELLLDINPDILAKGDRLKIIASNGGEREMGWLVVTSGGTEAVRGKVRGAEREIPVDSLLEFALPDDEQVNPFLPFIKTLAETPIYDPVRGPLRVALIDVTNPAGDRTEAGDKLLGALSRHICGRPQFECADRRKIAEEMWRMRIPTSRGMGEAEERELKTAIGPAILVSGHLLKSNGQAASLILRARDPEHAPLGDGIWRKFDLPLAMVGLTPDSFDRVTVEFEMVQHGLLRFRVDTSAELEGRSVDHIGTADLEEWIERTEGAAVVSPSGHFAVVDGESLAMNPDGRFRDKHVAPGVRRVRIGYYPSATVSGARGARRQTAVEKSFDVRVDAGETVEIVILSGMAGSRGVIAAELRRTEEN